MSSPSSGPPPTTSQPPPSASPSSGSSGSGGDPTTNATLYLYTFLATLVLLLAVSSAIVIRSLILRRRHQRLVEEAIRTGTWMPQHFNSTRRRRDIGQKPSLWDTWVKPNHDGETEQNEKRYWGDILPVYAAYVDSPAPSSQGPTTSSAENPADSPPRPSRFMRPFTRRRSPPSPQPATVSPMASQELSSLSSSPTALPMTAVRVAVLIAMPNPSQKHCGDSCGIPVVEFGVVEVNVTGDDVETSSHDSS